MDQYEQKLIYFIQTNKIIAQHLVFETSCHSVMEAAASANAKPEDFVKSLCIIDEYAKKLIVAIIPGNKRLDLKKLTVLLNTEKIRLAKPEEMLAKTGYPAGGTPPIGYKADFFIDKEIIGKEVVYCGGGSQNALTKISPAEIMKTNNAKIADLTR